MPTYRISLDSMTRVQSFDHEPTFEVDVKGVGNVRIEMLKVIGKQYVDFLENISKWKDMTSRAIVGYAVAFMDDCTFVEANQRVRCAGVFGDRIYAYRIEVTTLADQTFYNEIEMPARQTFLDVLAAVTESAGGVKYFRYGRSGRIPFKNVVSAKMSYQASKTSHCGVQAGTYLQCLAPELFTKERAICLAVEILEECSQTDAVEILRARGFEVGDD